MRAIDASSACASSSGSRKRGGRRSTRRTTAWTGRSRSRGTGIPTRRGRSALGRRSRHRDRWTPCRRRARSRAHARRRCRALARARERDLVRHRSRSRARAAARNASVRTTATLQVAAAAARGAVLRTSLALNAPTSAARYATHASAATTRRACHALRPRAARTVDHGAGHAWQRAGIHAPRVDRRRMQNLGEVRPLRPVRESDPKDDLEARLGHRRRESPRECTCPPAGARPPGGRPRRRLRCARPSTRSEECTRRASLIGPPVGTPQRFRGRTDDPGIPPRPAIAARNGPALSAKLRGRGARPHLVSAANDAPPKSTATRGHGAWLRPCEQREAGEATQAWSIPQRPLPSDACRVSASE
jgi:hypothetical protein